MIVEIGAGSGVAAPPPKPPPPPPPKPASDASPMQSDMVCPAQPQSAAAGSIFDRNGFLQFGTSPQASTTTSALKGAAMANPTSWFPQGPLPAKTTVTDPNGYRYSSDRFGRPQTSSADLSKNPSPSASRDSAARSAQRAAGGDDRLATDQGGHSIGNQFYGRNDAWNLTPQDANLNHSAYRTMENEWSSALKKGGNVTAETRSIYGEPTLRPTAYSAKYTVSGGVEKLRVMTNEPNAGFAESIGGAARSEATLNTLARVSTGLDVLGKVAVPVAVVGDGISIYSAYRQDGDTIGAHTLQAAGGAAGGWAGAAAGAEMGADGGAAVGALFGGVGAVPGAIIGGLAGGVVGGFVGSAAGKDVVKFGEDIAGDASHAASKVVDFGKSAVDSAKNAGSKVLSWVGL